MSDLHNSESRTNAIDSMLALDKDIRSFVAYSRTDSTFAPTILPVGINQISPNGINDEVDRYLFAPIPPQVMAHFGTTTGSMLSPTNVEPTAVAATQFQSDHRHVTPMPVETLSPVSSLNMARGSKCIAVDAKSAIVATHETHAALVANSNTSITHGKSEDQTLTAYSSYSKSEYFPVSVHRMLSKTCQAYNGSLMHWTECGNFFSINANHAMLSSVIEKYFKHNNYQSLRRQLNSYGFHRVASGENKGYWNHPNFFRDCPVESLKAVGKITIRRPTIKKNLRNRSNMSTACNELASNTEQLQLKKIGTTTLVKAKKKRSNLSKTCNKIVANKGPVKQSSKCAPLKLKAVSSTEMVPMNGLTVDGGIPKEAVNYEKARSYQVEKSFENKFYSGDRQECLSVEEKTEAGAIKGITSNPGGVALLVEDPFLPDFHYGASLFFEDSSNDALAALATVASFLPIEPTSLYTPITKSCNVIKPTPIHQAASSTNAVTTQDMKMTILADAACQFVATPIQLPHATDCDYFMSWNDNIDCCFDDAVSSYSLGTLSSPQKLILPFSDGSAFLSPVVSSTDDMVAEFCNSFT